jgi:hypothetical protein
MSPWTVTKRPVWPIYLGMAVIIAGLVAGYLMMTGGIGGDDDGGGSDAKTPGMVATETAAQQHHRPDLAVVSWGQTSGQLAVVVRNVSSRPIERMRVRITARDRSNAAVLSTTGTAPDVCCTIVGLPPGKIFGLFAELDSSAAWDIARVEVEPVSADYGKAGDGPQVRAVATNLQREEGDTVVTADLTVKGAHSGYVAAQAFLTGTDGRVAQVVSGRFYCFGRDGTREIQLHLFHTVPKSLRLDRVVAYALPAGVRPYVPWKCH